jgi:hypothetical protein
MLLLSASTQPVTVLMLLAFLTQAAGLAGASLARLSLQ